jgi:hypothetical protein
MMCFCVMKMLNVEMLRRTLLLFNVESKLVAKDKYVTVQHEQYSIVGSLCVVNR